MEVVEVRTPSSRAPPQSPKLGGCVGVFFNFFDLNKRLQGSRLFSKRLPADRPSKDKDGKAARDDSLIAAKLLLIAEENRSVPSSKKVSPEKAKASKQGSSSAPAGSSSSGKDGGVSVSPPKRVPSVVARLMGLESFPSSSDTRSTSTSRIADSSHPSSAPQSPRRQQQQQESYCRPDSTGGGAGDRGRSKMSCKGKVPASVRRTSPSPSASPSAAGERKSQPPPSSSAGTGKGRKAAAAASAMHVQASELGGKRSPRHHMHHQHTAAADSRSSYSSDSRFSESGGMSPVYVDPDLTCNTRHVPAVAAGHKGGGVVQEDTKAGLPKSNSSSPRRPILLPSKNNKKLSSPIRSPTRMGSKSAAILLEAAQKILEPNNVKGRVAGRPSPVKPFQDCENAGPVPGGRRSLDFRGISSGREWWEQDEDGGGAGSRRRAGSSSPGPRPHNVLGMHSVVTLRPCSPVPSERQVGGNNGAGVGAAMGMRGLDGVGEVDEGRAQVPTARAMLFGTTSPTRKRPGQLADVDAMPMASISFRVQAARDTDFEAVLSRYQDPPKVETGRKKEKEKDMFGKHNQLGKMTAEQKSELVRSLSVTDQTETLHRSGSVKEKVSSKVGSLLRSKSAREDKKLVKQAQFAEGQPVQQQQVKGNGDVVGKLGRAPAQRQSGSGTGNAKAFPGTTGVPSPYLAAGKVESGEQEDEKEKQDSAGARAMKVLRGKPGRRRRQEREEEAQECRDVSPPPGESRVFPAAGDAEMPTHISPGYSSESQGGSEVSSSGGGKGILSYSRLFRGRKEGHGDGEEEQSPKSSHSVRSLFRRKPTSPEAPAPVVLRRGSKKIQADMKAPGAGQAMSMSFDLDAEGFERGLSFDMGKLPLGCLISELADVLECKDKSTTSEKRHVGHSTNTAALGPVDADDSIQLRETYLEGGQDANRSFQLPDTDGFEEKTIDQDYQRRKSQARLTRALQRGAVTQFRGDVFKYDFSVDATMEEEERDEMFAAYIKSGIIDEFTTESTFQQDEPNKKFAGYIAASDSLMDQDLVCHSISLSDDAALDVDGVEAKKDAICILTECSQQLDSLKPSSISFDIGSYGSGSPLAVPFVKSRVFLSEEHADPTEAARKSTCSDDIGQPSPVSPLEAPFQDEAQDAASQEWSSPKASQDFVAAVDELEEEKAVVLRTVVDDTTASHHGAEKEQQSKVDGSTAPIETASILEAILDLSRIRQIDLANIGILEGAAAAAGADDTEDEDQAYITDILTKSKFLEKEPTAWFSQTLPINPDVFAQLENQERAWSETDSCKADSSVADSDTTSCSRSDSKLLQVQWLDRKLFFDCVNEAVCERLSEYSMDEPWVKKQVLRAVPAPTGKQLVKQVYEQVSQWRNMDVESLETLILYDMGHGSGQWTDLAHEVREIGLEIERHIFRVMIEELVKETLDSVPANLHFNS